MDEAEKKEEYRAHHRTSQKVKPGTKALRRQTAKKATSATKF
jgi:hypothetical protein